MKKSYANLAFLVFFSFQELIYKSKVTTDYTVFGVRTRASKQRRSWMSYGPAQRA